MVVSGSADALDALLTVANARHDAGVECGVTGDDRTVHDHLRDPGDAVRFLAANHVAVPGGAPGPDELRDLRRLREAVVSLVDHDSLAAAASLLRRAHYRLDEAGRFEAVGSGWPGFIIRLLPSLIEVRTHRAQLKTCSDPTCRWLFFDRSKNHARVWCDMATCGNRAKAKRFLTRRRS